MTLLHGGRGLVVGGLTWAISNVAGITETGGSSWGNPQVISAIIAASALVLTAVGAPLFLDWFRRHRKVNHTAEAQDEQSMLSNRLMTELEAVRGELTWERNETKRLRAELSKARGPGGNQRRNRDPASGSH